MAQGAPWRRLLTCMGWLKQHGVSPVPVLNAEVAEILSRTAEFLEIEGPTPFACAPIATRHAPWATYRAG